MRKSASNGFIFESIIRLLITFATFQSDSASKGITGRLLLKLRGGGSETDCNAYLSSIVYILGTIFALGDAFLKVTDKAGVALNGGGRLGTQPFGIENVWITLSWGFSILDGAQGGRGGSACDAIRARTGYDKPTDCHTALGYCNTTITAVNLRDFRIKTYRRNHFKEQ